MNVEFVRIKMEQDGWVGQKISGDEWQFTKGEWTAYVGNFGVHFNRPGSKPMAHRLMEWDPGVHSMDLLYAIMNEAK